LSIVAHSRRRREMVAKISGPRGSQIRNLHDPCPAFLELSAPVLEVGNALDGIAVLIKAGEMSTHFGSRTLNVVKSRMGNQDGDERRAIQHGKPHAAYRLPRWVAYR
jgi:hypothetical protein